MRRQGLGWLTAGLVVLAAVSCFKDPTSSLQGSAARLVLSANFASVTARPDTQVITIQAQDAQGNFKAFGAPTYTSLDPTVATMVPYPDPVIGTVPGNTLWKALLIAGAQFGTTKIAVTAAGVTDTISVLTLPVAFAGTITPASVHPGDTVTITPPAGITFGATAAATASGGLGFLSFVSGTASALKYIAGASGAAQTVTVTGSQFGATALPALTSSATFSVVDQLEPGNNTSAGAVAIGALNAANDSLVVFSAMDGGDAGSDSSGTGADYYMFTMNVTGTVSVQLDFSGPGTPGSDAAPDLDVVLCTTLANSRCSYKQATPLGTDLMNNAASGSTNPEKGTSTSITAGSTVYVRVYGYFGSPAGSTGYRLRVKTP